MLTKQQRRWLRKIQRSADADGLAARRARILELLGHGWRQVEIAEATGAGIAASMSIPQNIAEGVGKPTDADRKRFYGIARGSTMECGAILDASRVLKILKPSRWERGKSLLVRIVSMLTKMCR